MFIVIIMFFNIFFSAMRRNLCTLDMLMSLLEILLKYYICCFLSTLVVNNTVVNLNMWFFKAAAARFVSCRIGIQCRMFIVDPAMVNVWL